MTHTKYNYSGEPYEINGRAVVNGLPAERGQPGIFPGEYIWYPDRARWWANNGFRRHWLTNGQRHANAINAARRGNLIAVLAHVATMGGATQHRTIARSALTIASRLSADVPSYRIEGKTVYTPRLTWAYRGRRQTAKIEWTPMWGCR